MMAWEVFYNPMELGWRHVWLLLPLLAVCAIVYKTVRAERPSQIPRQVAVLWLYIMLGLVVLGGAFYLLLEYVA
jgi:hypothetical protein